VVAGAFYDEMHQIVEELLRKRIILPRNGRHGLN